MTEKRHCPVCRSEREVVLTEKRFCLGCRNEREVVLTVKRLCPGCSNDVVFEGGHCSTCRWKPGDRIPTSTMKEDIVGLGKNCLIYAILVFLIFAGLYLMDAIFAIVAAIFRWIGS